MRLKRQDKENYKRAIKKVETVKSFYIEVTIFLIVNTILFMINLNHLPSFYWSIILLIVWGGSLVKTGVKLFTEQEVLFGSNWEKRMIKKMMNVNILELTKEEDVTYLKVLNKVHNIRGFYSNLILYFVFIPILIFVNLKYTPHYHWFWFSVLGWGLGVLSHAFQVFEWYKIFLGKDWEERKILEIMSKKEYNGK